MTTIAVTLLVSPKQMGNVDAAYYTTPANTTAKIGRAVFSNPTAGAVTVTVNIGSTSSASNQILNAVSIGPGETYVSSELAGFVLPASYSIRGLASAAAAIVIAISGVTIV